MPHVEAPSQSSWVDVFGRLLALTPIFESANQLLELRQLDVINQCDIFSMHTSTQKVSLMLAAEVHLAIYMHVK